MNYGTLKEELLFLIGRTDVEQFIEAAVRKAITFNENNVTLPYMNDLICNVQVDCLLYTSDAADE